MKMKILRMGLKILALSHKTCNPKMESAFIIIHSEVVILDGRIPHNLFEAFY